MFLFGTPGRILSNHKERNHSYTCLKELNPSNIVLEPLRKKVFGLSNQFTVVYCSSYEVNGSSQASSSSSQEEIERKRQYLERKYRFFEKEFACIQPCTFCKGSGKIPCKFCNGTGFMTLGDTLLCSVSGNCDCVVCRAQGEVDCEHCRGTGHIAGWLS
ncbi:hypothetical protein Gasu2_50220 [Galdieria sulphuraria]|nr:hypothetical protein Gasu2_50220 [Galdieria sulphuraria]